MRFAHFLAENLTEFDLMEEEKSHQNMKKKKNLTHT